ncbi:NAD-dependent epimerase/dehydratase family protein [bacterium]|nr:NAD-dependent epimerase/dehydratase family protein [bacterium]
MSKILVTGGAGFIASWVAEEYISKGHEVVIIDDLSTGSNENIPRSCKFIELDIRDPEIDEIFKSEKFDCVNHHAAQISVRVSVEQPILDAKINLLGTLNLLESCVKYNVNKFIFASTGGAIYGNQSKFPADESHPLNPLCPYAVHKLTVEKYLYYYKEIYGLKYICLRYANAYGPRQNPFGEAGVVAIFSERMLDGKDVVINGDGTQTRDFVYVTDIARSNLLALDYDESDCFNIGTGIETDINEIFGILKIHTGYEMHATHGPAKEGEQQRSCLDYTKITKLLGWKPETGLSDGLKNTVEYFKDKHNKS